MDAAAADLLTVFGVCVCVCTGTGVLLCFDDECLSRFCCVFYSSFCCDAGGGAVLSVCNMGEGGVLFCIETYQILFFGDSGTKSNYGWCFLKVQVLFIHPSRER